MSLRSSIIGPAIAVVAASCGTPPPPQALPDSPVPSSTPLFIDPKALLEQQCRDLQQKREARGDSEQCQEEFRLVEGIDGLSKETDEVKKKVKACLHKDFETLDDLRKTCRETANCGFFFTGSLDKEGFFQHDCSNEKIVPNWYCVREEPTALTPSCRPIDLKKIAEEKMKAEERRQNDVDNDQAVKNILMRMGPEERSWWDTACWFKTYPLSIILYPDPQWCLPPADVEKEIDRIREKRVKAPRK